MSKEKELEVLGLLALEPKDRKLLSDVLAGLKGKAKAPADKEGDELNETEENSEENDDAENAADPFGDENDDAETEHTIEDVRTALRAFSKAKDQAAAVKLMNKIGKAKTVDSIKQENFGAVIEAVKKAGVKLK